MPLNVLLVEPDSGLAEEIRRAFAPLGFTVSAVQAGEPAIERCKETPPDLILLAAELPDMSGFSVCNRLKRALSSVPLVLYTAEATDAAIEAHRATRTRADDYLKKPFEVADLLGRAATLLQADQPGPPPPPAPPSAPRPDGKRTQTAEVPPVLQRMDSGQVAAKGMAAALEAARAAPGGPSAPPPRPSRPSMPAVPAAAAGAPAAAPPPVPPPVPGQKAAAIGRIKPAGSSRDPFAVLEEWPRDPAPPKGTPEEKLEYFRERLRARDAFLGKVRDALGELKGSQAELAAERDLLQTQLEQERDKALGLEGRVQEAAQDAAAQAARIDDLRRQLEESENTRQSLSDVLSETIQQREAAEQDWATRSAENEAERARLETQLAEQAEAHARAVAALEAERADERARAEASRAEAEEAHARELQVERDDRERERGEAASRQQLAEERITALGVERDKLAGELAAREQEHELRVAGLEQDLEARAREAADEAAALRGRIDEVTGRADGLEAELGEARSRIAALEEEGASGAKELKESRAETRAYEEKAIAAEHAYQAKAAELAAAEQRIRDLGAALDEGRASAEGARGEVARLDEARGGAERRAAQLQADRDQLSKELDAARREVEAANDATAVELERAVRLQTEVARLAKLEPVAEEAARLRKEVGSMKDLLQARTVAAENAARTAQAGAAERARAEERLAVESGRMQAQAARLEQELGLARRRVEELERDGTARNEQFRKAGQETEERRRAIAAQGADAEQRHAAEVTRLKAAMVELEKHLEARARAELQLKKRLQEVERAAQAKGAPAATDPALVQQLKGAIAKLNEELEELRTENDFLNGEVARYNQKNKDLAAQLASLRET
jgi:DNA-binding response OmpR family regulator/chromosome segregation ATPase